MALEIERKFLVHDDRWQKDVRRSTPIRQAYFCRTPLVCARVRVLGAQGFITLKSEPGTLVRDEFEYEIPQADALAMIDRFSIESPITKTRHEVTHDGNLWFVDVFEGPNAGLVIAEVELERADQLVAIPAWAGPEVTTDRRYGNSRLASNPYGTWRPDEKHDEKHDDKHDDKTAGSTVSPALEQD